ncbi:hypothetical protein GE107_10720 [Cohnella sp. CFH 77786]|uniref:hypothetical protein n=1 Tax=Cohnella sp. CFH 77786 TaxID=2662265 RepID=UPI001C60C9CE|nr:hypothetical protein [Cohnella sp. CFH 77786]MBW5446531.1 hypothetical protein [Cohnella sp. CFH 77786]
MKLDGYKDQYIKIYLHEDEWFICEPLVRENDKYKVNIICSNNKGRYATGITSIFEDQIKRIEEIDKEVQQGIRMTIENVPDIKEVYKTMDTDNLQNRVTFGQIIREQEND